MKYKNILVAIDLTKDFNKIIKQGCSIAKTNNSKISVVNVVPPFKNYYAYSHFDEGIHYQELENNVVHRAKENLNNLLVQFKTKIDSIHVSIGPVAETIRSISKKLDSDLIIIGTHARSGIGKFILGSTAHSLLGGIEIDVLIVNLNDNSKDKKTKTSQEQTTLERVI